MITATAFALLSLGGWTQMWDGTGTFTDSESKNVPCESFSLALEVKGTQLQEYYTGRCDLQVWEESLNFDIRGKSLWLDGKKVGSISPTEITYKTVDAGSHYHYSARFTLLADGQVRIHDQSHQNYYSSRLDATLPVLKGMK